MTDSRQDLLRSAWLDAKDGSLSGREQAKAWALREIWKDSGKADYGMKTFIAGKLKKKGGGSPSSEAMTRFFDKVEDAQGSSIDIYVVDISSSPMVGWLATPSMTQK